MYRLLGNFPAPRQASISGTWYDISKNNRNQELALCTFEGGHTFRSDFIAAVWERLNLE
jgi:hypothetical protein